MNAPSIEASLSRRNTAEDAHPVAKRLNHVPVLGYIVRAWVRVEKTTDRQALWASLPPLAAA